MHIAYMARKKPTQTANPAMGAAMKISSVE
jgi:hypothetical protein